MNTLVDNLFKGNDLESALAVCEHLLLLCRSLLISNTLKKIDLTSEIFQEHFLCTDGAMEILYHIGFQEGEDCFCLPSQFDRTKVEELQSLLETSRSLAVNTLKTQKDKRRKHLVFNGIPSATNAAEFKFQSEVLSSLDNVQQHEDPVLHQKALALLPLDELKRKTQQNSVLNTSGSTATACPKDLLLLELLAWFKRSFFLWVDVPNCPWCGGQTTKLGNATPGTTDILWGARRVEAYSCQTCHVEVRFPRFNDPGHLLFTRKGRCGEWANCFLLFLRALGYEARFINDSKDHVWTEAYSQFQKRWLHCDPCECVCDKPLLYENDWKKDVSNVWAYAANHLQDVTWRYTSDHRVALSKRKKIRETWLVALIQAWTVELQASLSEQTRQELLHKRLSELVEFLSPPVSTSTPGQGGRTSGSLAWRLARGETHLSHEKAPRFVFVPLPKEVSSGKMEIVYSPITDSYSRLTDESVEDRNLKGWSSGTWEFQNIFRKEEHDWKQVYLCVQEGKNNGHLTWRFELQGTCQVHCIKVKCKSTVFQKGLVWWSLTDGKRTVDIQNGELAECSAFAGARELILNAHLICGEHWQHAQLFRSDTSKTSPACSDYPLHISITFSKEGKTVV